MSRPQARSSPLAALAAAGGVVAEGVVAEGAADEASLLAAVADSTREAILVTDGSGTIVYANAAARSLLGPAAGGSLVEREPWRDLVLAALTGAEVGEREVAIGDVVLHARARPHRDRAGVLVGAILCVRDMTDWLLAHRDLRQRVEHATRELAATNRELTGFVRSLSHDLRGPLRTIRGFAGALAERGQGLDGDGRHYLDRLQHASTELETMMEALLDLCHAGEAPLERVPLNLSRIAVELHGELLQAYPGRAVELVTAPSLPVQGDPRLVRLLLRNLLDNAFKFTARVPRARIELGRSDDNGAWFVRDNGIGFAPAQAASLFQPFVRLHAREGFAGCGVGLTTVARIARRHGGEAWADATPGAGATFYFRW